MAAASAPTPETLKEALRGVVGADILAGLDRPAESGLPDGPRTVLEGLARHLGALMRWNARMNLVGARNWRDAARDLVADSLILEGFLRRLQASGILPAEPLSWDLGAGAGLPGIPLRLVWHDGAYHLVEAREKRAVFLMTVLADLGLPRTDALRGRAEDLLAASPRGADLILSRAFMPWRELLAFAGPHLADGGVVLLMSREDDGVDADALPAPWRQADAMDYESPRGRRRFRALVRTAREARA